MRRIYGIAIIFICVFGGLPAQAQETFECIAKVQDVGRETDDQCAALRRSQDDGKLVIVDVDGRYYTGTDPNQSGSEWVELYGVPHGHGNTFLGFFKKANFACSPH